MYTNTRRNDFIDTFRAMGRMKTHEGGEGNFTIEALHALFDYLEQYEQETGMALEFDVIALCCQFSQYEDAADAVHAIDRDVYRDVTENNDPDTAEENLLDWLHDQTIVIGFPGGIIIDSEF